MIDQGDPFFGEVDYYSRQEIWGFKESYPINAIHDFLGAIKDHVSRIQSIIDANIPIQNAEYDLQQIVKYYQAYCALILDNGTYRGYDKLFFGTIVLLDREGDAIMMSQDELWDDIFHMINTINRIPLRKFLVGSGMDALIELIGFYQCILCKRIDGRD